MKKIIITISAFLYLSVSVGANVHLHYCMGKLIGWGLLDTDLKKCNSCDKEKKAAKEDGCCKNEHKEIKIEKDQEAPGPVFQMQPATFAISAVAKFETGIGNLSFKKNDKSFDHAPPLGKGIDAYILNCVFRI